MTTNESLFQLYVVQFTRHKFSSWSTGQKQFFSKISMLSQSIYLCFRYTKMDHGHRCIIPFSLITRSAKGNQIEYLKILNEKKLPIEISLDWMFCWLNEVLECKRFSFGELSKKRYNHIKKLKMMDANPDVVTGYSNWPADHWVHPVHLAFHYSNAKVYDSRTLLLESKSTIGAFYVHLKD